jgi:cystinosin
MQQNLVVSLLDRNPAPRASSVVGFMEDHGRPSPAAAPLQDSSTTTTTTTLLLSDDHVEGAAAAAARPVTSSPPLPSSSAAGATTTTAAAAADEDHHHHHLEVSNDGGGGGDDRDRAALSSSLSSFFRRLLYLLTSPLTDDQGRQPLAIFMGLLSMALGGMMLGLILPKSSSLPTQVPWLSLPFISYRTISSCIGYTYFLSWSTSFYPQLVANFRRKTTAGLSADFCVLNVLGFSWYVLMRETCLKACISYSLSLSFRYVSVPSKSYTAYNVALYTSPMIRRLYHERNHHQQQQQHDDEEQNYNNDDGSSIPVQSNDVAFAVHALLVSSMTLFQIGYYDGFRSQRPSKVIAAIIAIMLTIIMLLPVYIVIRGGGNKEEANYHFDEKDDDGGSNYYYFFSFHKNVPPHVNWLDYLYVLSSIKVWITLIKYMPQVVLNCQRQSTTGWSIWQILLDMTGGVLSDLQLVLDCAALQDWTGVRIYINIVLSSVKCLMVIFRIVPCY